MEWRAIYGWNKKCGRPLWTLLVNVKTYSFFFVFQQFNSYQLVGPTVPKSNHLYPTMLCRFNICLVYCYRTNSYRFVGANLVVFTRNSQITIYFALLRSHQQNTNLSLFSSWCLTGLNNLYFVKIVPQCFHPHWSSFSTWQNNINW